jgi:3-oxoacyl-[acyl-carrier protein] reductase
MLPGVRIGSDTRVLITGASRGIGSALASALAQRGCTVGLLARSEDELHQLAELIDAGPGSAVVLPADVGEFDQVERAISEFRERVGAIDVLVANAGVAWYGPARDMPIEEAERMTRVNWLGTLYTVQAALPHMLDRAEGTIVIVSSAAGHRSFPWASVYGATKFAQRGYLEALRHELSGTGVDVLGVYPGEVETHLHDDDQDNGRMPDWYRPDAAIAPEKVAAAIVEAVEARRRSVFVPPQTRALGLTHGISPKLADALLRRILGATAAPRRD